jgi:DNA polymerase III delta prime subunit
VNVTAASPGEREPGCPVGGAYAASLGQQLAAAESRVFQGRGAEARRVWRLLATAGSLPRVLCLHGPPGIGKTAFIYALARGCDSRGYPVVILDSRDFTHDPAVLREVIAERCAAARAGKYGRPLLLVLDTFEEMQDLERALWDDLLPSLNGPVLLMLSGRVAAPPPCTSRNWRDLVDELELGGLSPGQARRLLGHHGISDPDTVDAIAAFADGNPLFLTVAARHARSRGEWDSAHTSAVARSLMGCMTSEIVDPSVRGLLEAASLVRTFNQEMVAAMTGRDVARSAFNELCSLSVVRVVPLGARLHDLVRESVAADLSWRSPAACQAMRRRAHGYLVRLAASSRERGAYAQELLHLAASSSPLARFYAASRPVSVRVWQANPGDRQRLTELCRAGITRFGLPAHERARQLNADFDAAQGSCAVALDDDGTITGFAYSLPLSEATWRAAAQTRRAYFATLPTAEMAGIKAAPAAAPRAALVTGTTHLPGYDYVNAPLREALFTAGRDRYPHTLAAGFTGYHLLTRDSLELADIASAGLRQRTTGIRVGGSLVDEWVLEFGGLGFAGWIAEALGIDAAKPYAQQIPERDSPARSRPRSRTCIGWNGCSAAP